MTVDELVASLLGEYPVDSAEPWDHVGLSVGDPAASIAGVTVALDATMDSLRAVREVGANVLVTHHPVYIKAPDMFAPNDPSRPCSSAVVYEAARTGVSIISLHTNLDRSLAARNRLCDLIGISHHSSLEFPADPASIGLGAVGEVLPSSLEELAARCGDAFDTTPRVWGDPATPVTRVAVLGGSLGSFGELALSAGAEAIVCGEAGYHICQDLSARGCAVVLLGHDRSEEPFVDILANSIKRAGVDAEAIHTIDSPAQWWTYTKGESS